MEILKYNFECTDCHKTFTSRNSLGSHQYRKHRTEMRLRRLEAAEKDTFFCTDCEWKTDGKIKFTTHLKEKHGIILVTQNNASWECYLCHNRFHVHLNLRQHCQEMHGCKITVKKEQFDSETSFKNWLKKLECVRFVSQRTKKAQNGTYNYMYCHRNPTVQRTRGRGIRRRKQLPPKYGKFCTAFLRAFIGVSGSVSVEYSIDHLGHEINDKIVLQKGDKCHQWAMRDYFDDKNKSLMIEKVADYENRWKVESIFPTSSIVVNFHIVQFLQKCQDCTAEVENHCPACGVCPSEYSCDCCDNSKMPCKHIHAVVIKQQIDISLLHQVSFDYKSEPISPHSIDCQQADFSAHFWNDISLHLGEMADQARTLQGNHSDTEYNALRYEIQRDVRNLHAKFNSLQNIKYE